MTKFKLLTTASVAVLALAITSPALAGAKNNFANSGDGYVKVKNNNDGGSGGDAKGGDGEGPGTDQASAGLGGDGGIGGEGGAGGTAENNVNANSGNTYLRNNIKVHAKNVQHTTIGYQNGIEVVSLEVPQPYFYGSGKIDTSGGSNSQSGGSAHSDADAEADAHNYNKTSINGGKARTGSAESTNKANTDADGGEVKNTEAVDQTTGDASAHATGGVLGTQDASATSGNALGGNGGVSDECTDQGCGAGSSNSNDTLGGTALANANGGNTSGTQDANGGDVGSGVLDVNGLGQAAGAFAMSFGTGQFALGNTANAVAAHVNTINTAGPGGGGG